jgi:hypothetical protein
MGILPDVFMATEREVLAAPFDRHSPGELFPTLEAKGLTTLEWTCLEMVIHHEDPDALETKTFVARADWPQVGDWGDEIWIHRLPDALVAALAALPAEEAAPTVSRWLRTEQMRSSVPSAIDQEDWLTDYLRQLARLAGQALADKRALYLWISL